MSTSEELTQLWTEFENKYPARDFVLVERNGKTPVAIHIVHKPTVYDGGFYRQTTSFEAFRRHQSKIFSRWLKKRESIGHWFYGDFRNHWEFHYEVNKRSMSKITGKDWDEFRGVPRVEHENVWAFYKAIHWDYKRKKFE